MKKTVCKCLLTCLVFVFVMMINVPAYAKSSKKSKVAMPKTVRENYLDENGEASPYSASEYTFSYDKSGRISKISGVSKATDGTWTYSISYKKSGKNTKVTIKYVPDWADDPETYTYKFNSKGYLISNNNSSKWEFDYVDDSKEALYLYAENSYLAYFDNKAKIDMFYRLEGEKAKSMTVYYYEKEKMIGKVACQFDEAIDPELITEELLLGVDKSLSQYEVKTSKVSMTNAVKWMNTVLLLDFVYRD